MIGKSSAVRSIARVGCEGVRTSSLYDCRASWMTVPTEAYCLQNLGVTLT